MTASWSTPLVRCTCSHGPSTHTGGYGKCHIFVCCCESYRDPAELQGSQDRHPAGKNIGGAS